MALILETILTDGIAQLSYLVGDDTRGTAAVIDPRTDVDVYLKLARKHGLTITHIFETHIHADFMSGSRELADRLGIDRPHVSAEGNAAYEFQHHPVRAGDTFDFGSFILTARHTPGHTPEHLAFEIAESDRAATPFAVFTGDSLFVGSAGRPDLLGDQSEGLAEQLFSTLYDYYALLDDYVIIYPGHGAGSACGASIGDRLVSTIGYERRTNKFLKFEDLKEFKHFVIEEAPPAPSHYSRLKKTNGKGPAVLHRLPTIPGLTPVEFSKATNETGVSVIDTRRMLAFGGGHVPGAINIGDRAELSNWAGEMLDPNRELLLILEDEKELDHIARLLLRTGFTKFRGYLVGGMKAWDNAGLPLERLPQITVHELKADQENGKHYKVVDVRSPQEFEKGHIPGAEHHFVSDMRIRITGLDKDQPIVTYCASGYRASLASSLMRARGFKSVANVPGSWKAWTEAGYPCEKESNKSEAK